MRSIIIKSLLVISISFDSFLTHSQLKTDEREELQSYEKVILPGAISNRGFFITHLVKDKLFFEVPENLLNTDMMMIQYDNYIRGQQYVRWIVRGQKIQLVIPEIISQSDYIIPPSPFENGLENIQRPAIVGIFPIATRGGNGSVVFDATEFFLKNSSQEFMENGGYEYNQQLSFIEKASAYPNAVEIQLMKTAKRGAWRLGHRAILTYSVYWSFIPLPEKPMLSRLFDPRMGFFMESLFDAGTDYRRAASASILRWKLEKKDHLKILSEPITPIVFYLDPKIPEKWKPWVREGIYAWLPAFEAAGFKNAIVVRDAPTNDPEWSVNSSRYSIIKWLDNTNVNEFSDPRSMGKGGGTANWIVDRRSGEILKADIIINTPYEYLQDRYFVRCAPLDRRARQIPFPIELMGELIQSLVSHEAGHALGLRDGNYGEYTYPAEKMRSYEWLRKMGHTPSIMTYARENYIAQPEDSIPPALLIQHIGPADIFSIVWAYKPIYNVNSPKEELPTLDRWLQEQDTVPWYRFVRPGAGDMALGPCNTSEVVDNNNPVLSTTFGLKNLRRVMELLPDVALSSNSDNILLEHLYFRILDQWINEMRHVVSMVGGFNVHYKSGSQPGPVYTPIPGVKQREAVDFLNREAFTPPLWLVNINVTRRFEAQGTITNITKIQKQILKELLSFQRLLQINEIEITAYERKQVYTLDEMLMDVRNNVWNELNQSQVMINAYRQEVQQYYLTIMKELFVSQGVATPAKMRGLLYTHLQALQLDIKTSIKNVQDNSTKGHLELSMNMISQLIGTNENTGSSGNGIKK